MKTSLKTFPWGYGATVTAEWARNFRDELLNEYQRQLAFGIEEPLIKIREILGE